MQTSFHIFLLDLFASIALISATMVIVSKNPIHSVAFLTLVFCNATGLLILLKIEFIAVTLVTIYVGAIAVLFLFVVMMLNIKVNELRENWLRYLPIGGLISVIFSAQIILTLDGFAGDCGLRTEAHPFLASVRTLSTAPPATLEDNFFCCGGGGAPQGGAPPPPPWAVLVSKETNTQSLGLLIYTYYFYYFVLASLVLLVAMIGAVALANHKRQNASKKQLIFKQVARNFEDAAPLARGPTASHTEERLGGPMGPAPPPVVR